MDLDRIKRNVAKMAAQSAPESDIDGYIASEGATIEQIRAHKPQAQPDPSWWQRNITGLQDPAQGQLPSVYSQYPGELEGPTGRAALLGASDAQMGDIVQKSLGDRFIRREKDANGYDVFITRGADGQEQKAYLNKPGLDGEDVARGIRGALPYMLTGGAAGVVGRGAGLIANMALQGGAGAATSVVGDAAQIPMGSKQGIEGEKALWAGGLSAAAPAAGRLVGNTVGAVKEYLAQKTGPISAMSPRAVSAVEEALLADGKLSPATYAAKKSQLGPEAMLGDMGATLQGDTAVLARTPVAKDIAATALRERQGGATDRIKSAVKDAVGRERNLPRYVDQMKKVYNSQAKPFYDQFHQAPILASKRLKEIMSRVPKSAFNAAERLARSEGIKQKFKITQSDDVMSAMTGVKRNNAERVIQGVEYDYVKRAIDDLAKNAAPGSNEQRIFGNLARDLRTEVDSILSPSDPTMSPWAQARSIAGEGIEGKEAVDLGAGMFSKKKDPNIVDYEMDGMSAYGKEMVREGARNDLRQVMGRASSNFGPKGDSAARRALNSEFSRDNVSTIAGPIKAARLSNRINTENQFAELHDMALGNSITDTMQASRKRLGLNAEPGDFASEAGRKGPIGLITEFALKAADKAVGKQFSASTTRKAVDMAKMLTATGRDGDAIVNALFKHIESRKAGQISGQKFERIIQELMKAGAGPTGQYMAN